MEIPIPHGRNPSEGEEEDQDESNSTVFKTRIPLMMLPGSTSSSSSTLFRWSDTTGSATATTAGTAGTAPSSSGGGGGAAVEKEHMFDKVVTPSDVGKLNRLVIPKQYAEKYFPLDPTSGEKGLLLSFEDRTGKPWRFRYSYWNSSQSYVMTKGWSRFVKEKRLDAGDTVSFGRGKGEQARDRLFIDWKRRSDAATAVMAHHDLSRNYHHHHQGQLLLPFSSFPFPRSVGSWGHHHNNNGTGFYPPPATLYEHHQNRQAAMGGQQFMWFRSGVSRPPPPPPPPLQMGNIPGLPVVLDSVPVGSGPAATAAKRVRLFGVNLDGPNQSERNNNINSSLNDANNVVSLTVANNNWQSRPIITSALPLFELSSNYNGSSSASAPAVVVDSTSSNSSRKEEGHSSLDLDL